MASNIYVQAEGMIYEISQTIDKTEQEISTIRQRISQCISSLDGIEQKKISSSEKNKEKSCPI